jgi:hypothetical protein
MRLAIKDEPALSKRRRDEENSDDDYGGDASRRGSIAVDEAADEADLGKLFTASALLSAY